MLASVLVVTVIAAAPDAGAARIDVKRIIEGVFAQAQAERDASRAEEIAAMRAAVKNALPGDRPMLERALRLMESNEPPEKAFIEMVALLREVTPRARGDWESERALGGAWLSVPMTAQSLKLDAAPLQTEATAYARDLATRYPKEARAHGLVASALMAAQADEKELLAALKRCAELDRSSWCTKAHGDLVEGLERPRCSGNTLTRPLTMWRAKEWQAGAAGRVVEQNGQKLVLEGEPFVRSGDFSSVSLDGEGNLALELGAAAEKRFADETGRLAGAGGSMALLLSDEVLLVARVMERIPRGRIRVWMGNKKGVTLEALCSRVERPKVSESLKLK